MMTNREIAEKCLRDEAQAILNLIPQLDESFDKAVELTDPEEKKELSIYIANYMKKC